MPTNPLSVCAALAVLAATLGGCFGMRPSRGGGQTQQAEGDRRADPADVAVLPGYEIQSVAQQLTYPTAVAFDDDGRVYVVEAGYSYGEDFAEPRLLRLDDAGRTTVVARGANGPWTGAAYADGFFYVAEGGVREGGRILKIDPQGSTTVLVEGLPSRGDHHTDGPVVRQGWVYFGQGTATNSGIVGPDNAKFGWLARAPGFHDVPCTDVELSGENAESANPLTGGPGATDRVRTGPYLPFGTASTPGQIVKGQLRCSGSVLRVRVSGGDPELVAWGFRNPFGLAFTDDGRLLATDNGYDDRGSRPVFGAPDVLWEVRTGGWYGWPDHVAGRPIDEARWAPPRGPKPKRLLAQAPGQPPAPLALLPVHSSSNGFDVGRTDAFGFRGQVFVAQFGDQAPDVGKVMGPVGFKVVVVDPATGESVDFAVNRGKRNGPASHLGTAGLERPIAVRFDPTGRSLYVVDFGRLGMDAAGSHPRRNTGGLWRISRGTGAPR